MDELIATIERLLRSLDDGPTDRFLSLWPAPPWRRRDAAARGLPALRWLDAACADGAPGTAALLQELRAQAAALAWAQSYAAADVGEAFLDRYCWTEVIGLRGPVASERLAVGFLLLGPETEYPAHHHAAEEIYVPLSGLALWRRSEEDWRLRTPGTPIHHASGQSHAMRTRQTPLLALYLWRGGDLAEKSRFG
ncbi:MAG TPA: dimethylsulfonioproprionate lyase family protein [Roseiarcus sp.]|nr:dimethylsulfonioproprionate lyase family protein [Roseiarcus sp.]